MKRNRLAGAVLAGLTGVAGMVSVSHAVNLNPDGLGQVLLYPYYSARGGNDTLISVVNTTSAAKAVKVRFIEGLNSREVLDFNVYMSPFDVWTTAITVDESTGGGVLRITDTTCTVPYFVGNSSDGIGRQDFLTFQYTGDNFDAYPQTVERTASGYFEIIEMGSIPNDGDFPYFDAIKHGSNGKPDDCTVLEDSWRGSLGSDNWTANNQAGLEPPTGGLFGTAAIINVEEGTLFAYDATALDAFWEQGIVNHTDPGSLSPSLNNAATTSTVFDNGVVRQDNWAAGVQAVNATIMFDQLQNEYNVKPGTGTRSEWVITFPTKGFHTDFGLGNGNLLFGSDPIPPFTDLSFVAGPPTRLNTSCESMSLKFWDREEQTQSSGLIVSPPPPVTGFELCREVNVIRFSNDSSVPDASEIFKEPLRDDPFSGGTLSYSNFGLPSSFESGWLQFDFGTIPGSAGGGNRTQVSSDGTAYFGLPAIGFWAQRFSNGTLVDSAGNNVRSNYAGAFDHKGTRKINDGTVVD